MTVSDSILGGALSPAAAGGIPEALLEEAVYEAHRLAATIGKAGMDKWVYEDVFARTGTVFLTTVGYGIAALYGRAVKRVVDVHWKDELGLPEAMWVLEVENFGPFIVDGDCTGASLAALAIDKINPNFAREYAKLPDYVLKRIGEIDHSNPTTTTPILPQPCQSTGCSSYPSCAPSGWRVRSPTQSRCAELSYQSPVVESMRVSACS